MLESLAQLETLEFSGGSFRKFGEEFDPPRTFEHGQAAHYELLEGLGEFGSACFAISQDNTSSRLDQFIPIFPAHHCRFLHRGMFD